MKIFVRAILFSLFSAACVLAQPGTITTVVGAFQGGDGGLARDAVIDPQAITFDRAGNLFIGERNRIRKVTPDGVVSTIAGSGYLRASPSEGPAKDADVVLAEALATDDSGALYFSMVLSPSRIWRIDVNGNLSFVAGGINPENARDGMQARDVYLGTVTSLAFDSNGQLYFYDTASRRIRRINKDGTISTIAGNGTTGSGGDGGPGTGAQLQHVSGMVFDSEGNLLANDTSRIISVSAEGLITTIAGKGRTQVTEGAFASDVFFPSGIQALALQGDSIYLYLGSSSQIWRLDSNGRMYRVLGGGIQGIPEEGPLSQVRLVSDPVGGRALAFDPAGELHILNDSRVWRLTSDGWLRHAAGGTPRGGEGGAALFARTSAVGLWSANDGSLLAADWIARVIQSMDPAGTWRRFAFDGSNGRAQTGPALTANAFAPQIIRQDSAGNSYVVDTPDIVHIDIGGQVRRRIPVRDGIVSMAVAGDGALLVGTASSQLVRIESNGRETVVAGTGQTGFSGDGGPATLATFSNNYIRGIALDNEGGIFVSDYTNHRIRRINTAGIITTIAGDGRPAQMGDYGPAVKSSIGSPMALALDKKGNLYVATDNGRVIRKINPQGIITTIAGKAGRYGFSGDGGPAADAIFGGITDIAVDSNENIFVADWRNKRIRRIQGTAPFWISPTGLGFTYSLGAPAATQSVTLAGGDGDARSFSVASSAAWLEVTPQGGGITAESPVTLRVKANPASLPKGRYNAKLIVTDPTSGFATEVHVTMLISGTPQQLRLGQTGLTFTAIQGRGNPADQPIRVLNTGIGGMNWTASVSTLSGGSWLRVSPAQGRTEATGVAPSVQAGINLGTLTAGTYFGLVTVTAPGVDNSPQSAVVVLNVLPANASPGPQVDPLGGIVTSAPGGKPAPLTVRIANPSGQRITYTTSVSFPDQRQWFAVAPATGALEAGQSATLTVTPNVGTIPAGVYRGDLTIRFAPENITRIVNLILVVADGATASTAGKDPEKAADAGCTAKRLIPVFLQPGGSFAVTAGWPVTVEARIVDDCGRAVTAGRALVNFSTNDPSIALTSSGDGRWTGTWTARTARASGVNISVRAETETTPKLEGVTQITGAVRVNADQPVIEKQGFTDMATMKRGDPVAVGSLAAILGTSLAAETKAAESLPLPETLGDTRAVLGGRAMPLRSSSAGRLEGQVPWGSSDNTPIQLIVQRGRSYSPPEEVYLTATSVGIYPVEGKNQGLIHGRTDDGSLVLADERAPVLSGQTVVIWASGLGPVENAPGPGAAGPSDPLATVKTPIKLKIADQDAEIQEAVMAPGLVGVYRVTATVPNGLAPTASARVVLTVNEQSSEPVIISIGERSTPVASP